MADNVPMGIFLDGFLRSPDMLKEIMRKKIKYKKPLTALIIDLYLMPAMTPVTVGK